ncbi:unnamed protein product [Urochloa humidicola]
MLGGGRKLTIRDLVALAEPGWSPSSPSPSPASHSGSNCVIPDGSPFAAIYVPPPPPPPRWRRPWRLAASKVWIRSGCNPEISVGLLAAVAEPASARLRVAGPVRAGASGIMAAVAAADHVFRNGTSGGAACCCGCGGGARKWSVVDEVLVACKLCRRRLDDRTIYLYMDKGFCNPECRYKYFLEELYEQRRKLAAEARASKRACRNGKADLHVEAADDRSFRRRIFFAPDEVTTPAGSFD